MNGLQRGELSAKHSATITGGNLASIAADLKKFGYDIEVFHGDDKAISSIRVRDYDPKVASMVYGLFSIAGWRYGRELKLDRPRYVVA